MVDWRPLAVTATEPFIVEGDGELIKMHDTLETCYQRIAAIKSGARVDSGSLATFPDIIQKKP